MALYICPNCTRSINGVFTLPPVRAVTKCPTCGHAVERSVGSFAQAWLLFTPVVTLPLATFLFILFDADPLSESFLYCLGKGVTVTAVTLPIGGLLGGALGVLVGAHWHGRCVSGLQVLIAAQAYEASLPDPRFDVAPPAAPPTTSVLAKEVVCWHCANINHVTAADEPVQVRCSKCQAGLGILP